MPNSSDDSFHIHRITPTTDDHEALTVNALWPSVSNWGADGSLRLATWKLPEISFHLLEGRIAQAGQTFDAHAIFGAKGRILLLFVQRGSLCIHQGGQPTVELTTQTHNALFGGEGSLQLSMEALDVKYYAIAMAPAYFLQQADECGPVWDAFAQAVATRNKAQLFQKPIYIDLAIQTCLQQMQACTLSPRLQRTFFRAKALELMALQADAYHRLHHPKPQFVRTDYDRERIVFARDYLQQHMAHPPSLTKLALIAGINEFKLKRGFKELFGNTVFGYLADLRLALAQSELMDGRKTVTEIAFDLGYASLQHFSSSFKKRYGLTPSAFATLVPLSSPPSK